jgi:hypothetical protein
VWKDKHVKAIVKHVSKKTASDPRAPLGIDFDKVDQELAATEARLNDLRAQKQAVDLARARLPPRLTLEQRLAEVARPSTSASSSRIIPQGELPDFKKLADKDLRGIYSTRLEAHYPLRNRRRERNPRRQGLSPAVRTTQQRTPVPQGRTHWLSTSQLASDSLLLSTVCFDRVQTDPEESREGPSSHWRTVSCRVFSGVPSLDRSRVYIKSLKFIHCGLLKLRSSIRESLERRLPLCRERRKLDVLC